MNKRSSDKQVFSRHLSLCAPWLLYLTLASEQLAGKILSAIQSFEEYGGADAFKVIKSKVPTYCSIYI